MVFRIVAARPRRLRTEAGAVLARVGRTFESPLRGRGASGAEIVCGAISLI